MAHDTFRFHRDIFVIEFGWQEIGKRFSVWFYKKSFKFSLLWHSPFALLWKDKLVISSVLWNFNFSAPFLSQLTQIFNLFASHFFLTGWRWWYFSFYNLFWGTDEDSGAEVTGPQTLCPYFVIPTLWNQEYKMKPLYCGQISTPEFCCTYSVEPGYRCTSSRPFHPREWFPWVITFLFMEPILALLKKLPTINAAKVACSGGGKAVPQHNLGELEPAERNIVLTLNFM